MIFFVLMSPVLHFIMYAQDNSKLQLGIGDHCPDFRFSHIINFKESTLKLSECKGKLVIIDFWASWCEPCVYSLHKLDSLQLKFGKRILILPVTYENTQRISSFIRKNKLLAGSHLPFVTNDTIISRYFLHHIVPHEVWIDGNGRVLAITGHEQLTEKNIKALLNNEYLSLALKKDILDYDLKKPLLLGGLGNDYNPEKGNLRYSSLITGYINGLPSISGAPWVLDGGAKIISINIGIMSLYQMAFGTKLKPFTAENDPDFYLRIPSRTIWEKKDSSLYDGLDRTDAKDSLLQDNDKLFCYELILPKADSASLNTYSVQELNRYFSDRYGIEGVKEKRRVMCWVLTRSCQAASILSIGGKQELTIDDDNNIISLRNCTLNKFVFTWLIYEMNIFPTPIINETPISEPVDLVLKADPKNFQSVKKAFEESGFRFILEERELDMIIIRDKRN